MLLDMAREDVRMQCVDLDIRIVVHQPLLDVRTDKRAAQEGSSAWHANKGAAFSAQGSLVTVWRNTCLKKQNLFSDCQIVFGIIG